MLVLPAGRFWARQSWVGFEDSRRFNEPGHQLWLGVPASKAPTSCEAAFRHSRHRWDLWRAPFGQALKLDVNQDDIRSWL
jgi:hypothetical protein